MDMIHSRVFVYWGEAGWMEVQRGCALTHSLSSNAATGEAKINELSLPVCGHNSR